jgi:hypothetical protein
METGCYRIVEVLLRSYLKSHGNYLTPAKPSGCIYVACLKAQSGIGKRLKGQRSHVSLHYCGHLLARV